MKQALFLLLLPLFDLPSATAQTGFLVRDPASSWQVPNQNDRIAALPDLDSLRRSLRRFYQTKTQAEQREYQYQTRFRWLKYLPELGYQAATQSPVVVLRTSEIIGSLHDRAARRAKLVAIQQQNEVRFNQDLTQIIHRLRELATREAYYRLRTDMLALERQRFSIFAQQYANRELPPSAYLEKWLAWKEATASVVLLRAEITALKSEILIQAHVMDWEKL
ncbi:MAG: hypothetical protein H7Z75_19975 [Ferruginibacter sp.]|nr:hypothetical protein [Cytophagales bacterium]